MILDSVKEAILFDWAVVIISLILLYCSYFIFKRKNRTLVWSFIYLDSSFYPISLQSIRTVNNNFSL